MAKRYGIGIIYRVLNVHNIEKDTKFSHITQWSITQVSKSFADFEFQSGGGAAAIKIVILWNNLSVWHHHPQSYHISEKNILIKVCRSRTVYANCLFGHRITAAALGHAKKIQCVLIFKTSRCWLLIQKEK